MHAYHIVQISHIPRYTKEIQPKLHCLHSTSLQEGAPKHDNIHQQLTDPEERNEAQQQSHKQMPPKRKQPKPSSTSTTETNPPRSKLAKQHNLSPSQETAIHESFHLFSTNSSNDPTGKRPQTLPSKSLRRVLVALNAPPSSSSELKEFLSILDPDDTGEIEYEEFVAVAALKLHSLSSGNRNEDDDGEDEEVEKAFRLFTQSEDAGRQISIRDLRRVARELREEVSEEVLRDMIREAKGGGDGRGTVGLGEFRGVMRRAGVF